MKAEIARWTKVIKEASIRADYPAVDATQWYGVLTTGGTPQPVVDKLNRELVRILQLPEIKERFLASGYVAAPTTPQEFAQLIRDELAKWQKVVKATGVRVEYPSPPRCPVTSTLPDSRRCRARRSPARESSGRTTLCLCPLDVFFPKNSVIRP